MKKTELTKIEKQLLEEKKRIVNELSQFSHRKTQKQISTSKDSDNLGETDHDDENASGIAEFSSNLTLEFELEKALRDVDSALKQIKKGVYGTCKYCHQPIDLRRLIARPTSSSCVQCKKTLTQEL